MSNHRRDAAAGCDVLVRVPDMTLFARARRLERVLMLRGVTPFLATQRAAAHYAVWKHNQGFWPRLSPAQTGAPGNV